MEIDGFKAHWYYTIPVVIGVVLGAVYLLWLFQRVFLGEFSYSGDYPLKDLNLREVLVTLPLLVLIFWIGLYPRPFFRVMDASLNNLVEVVERNAKKGMAYGDSEEHVATLIEAARVETERTGR